LAAIGVAAGLAASAALTRAMGSLLYGVNPIDPLTYVLVAAGLVAAGLVAATGIASFIPSMRAASVNPVDALRAEH
jgi:ABC-type antimicrobial peptide transport system permease subunit